MKEITNRARPQVADRGMPDPERDRYQRNKIADVDQNQERQAPTVLSDNLSRRRKTPKLNQCCHLDGISEGAPNSDVVDGCLCYLRIGKTGGGLKYRTGG